ncbi:acyl-CoA carboxylase subunit beta [Desulfosarcina ovata]|uniref:Glutaconyl-CoA decarboxylase subunit alpha n=2 Tax=Desulfosarcina ovata TaxID=83564 RepID=A0A5K8A9Q1_9BACT|nr:carboxyl transferase domain-containing protein [Desulfosarcina ovata]BBO81971.1 glutaconyl-CoA decarboxylase subunit alpha [Desulfosarcina ovata subsp. sediminis]BBO89188.1 glutaconyl-CoA decarboxylase subunit alpha [Desulfosarcina ovata subsp. ovata]
MRPYFEKMPEFGQPLTSQAKKEASENAAQILAVEKEVDAEVQKVKLTGIPEEKINARGQLTVWQRLRYLIDPGTWCPLHTLYNPAENQEGHTNVFDGLGKISGRWAVIIGFDNKYMAGAWVAGQPDNILRVTNLAKRLNVPLVWVVNCSGVKLPEQEKFYANRRGSGTPFYRHAELNQMGIPVLAGIYGTNPAGGGYQGISPTILFAHKDCNIAVGGGGILSGMSPKGAFDVEGAEALISAAKQYKAKPPGSVSIHYDETGFFRHVFDTEEGVLDGLKEYMKEIPAYAPKFFRVAKPKAPILDERDLYHLLPFNQKRAYSFEQLLSRMVDGSEHMEFRPDYGPEVYTGLVKVDGYLVAAIGNRQGFLKPDYPEYADYPGIGGKLYRQGLIKMNEFVTLCGRDRIPIVWFQDTSGIDVGDIAEKAELLGLGQSLIYSIQQTDVPQILIVLRKGTAAAHYVMGGPTANRHNAFTLGVATTEIYVMHGETASAASYSRRLVKEKDAGRDLQPVVDKMNEMAKSYYDNSRPIYCAQKGLVDEIVPLNQIRSYLRAFAGAAYQNPKSICPQHQMILPRITKG